MQRIAAALVFLVALGPSGLALGQDSGWRHASSLFGEVKYPPNFAHFDYVNPDAPKGGIV
jgi:microcin C transport system substrate-binding protein